MFGFIKKDANKRPQKRTVATMGTAAFLGAVTLVGAPVTLLNEGVRLAPYYDSVGVLTWCGGETEVGYKPQFTYDECSTLFKIRYGYYSERTLGFYNEKAKAVVTPEVHAAMTDMSYNIGLNGLKKSSMIAQLNLGNVQGACNSILLYYKAGGKDCRVRSNNCYGVWERRLKMNKLCKGGLQ